MTQLEQKPVTNKFHPEITRLPELTLSRRIIRRILLGLMRLLVWLLCRVKVTGLENVPEAGGALIVSNHLGDADALVGITFAPRCPDVIAKSELYDYPILGKLLDAFGVIWIHRGTPDRRALRAAAEGLVQGRLISLAPEGRESLTGALEEGTNGAAYLAYKAGVPVLPVTFTGTENQRVVANIKRFRRTTITLTIGPPFLLPKAQDRRTAIHEGTELIMRTLASQLPSEYQGIYRNALETRDGGE